MMLHGLFTDSDLARILEHNQDTALDLPIQQVMTRQPTTVPVGTLLAEAIELLATRKISELPVVNEEGRPLGLIDITDVVGQSRELSAARAAQTEDAADWRSRTVRFPNT
jgi:arabinose-5-phosphate isomerase